MINLHESMGPGRDRTRDPWICSQLRICSQTRYRLRYAARQMHDTIYILVSKKHTSFSWSWVFMSLLSRATSINRTKFCIYLNTSAAAIISLIIGQRREKTCLRGFANNKGANQPAHPRRLISAFVIRLLERFTI